VRMAGKTVNMSGSSALWETEDNPIARWPGVETGDLIAKALQDHFDDVAAAPVPDKFLVLLAELEAREAASKSSKAPSSNADSPYVEAQKTEREHDDRR
ncbi:MAG: NepR family anti-sigma factor, partial [Bosea sp. (in: a-proteobacteria)]